VDIESKNMGNEDLPPHVTHSPGDHLYIYGGAQEPCVSRRHGTRYEGQPPSKRLSSCFDIVPGRHLCPPHVTHSPGDHLYIYGGAQELAQMWQLTMTSENRFPPFARDVSALQALTS
jgi:hypothetical protein